MIEFYETKIKQNIVNYFNTINIGEIMEYTKVVAASTGPEYNTTDVLITYGGSTGRTDLSLVAGSLIITNLASITITIV